MGLDLVEARQVERLDVLLKLLPRYADWGYQELYLHLEDAVEYPSLPAVARRDNREEYPWALGYGNAVWERNHSTRAGQNPPRRLVEWASSLVRADTVRQVATRPSGSGPEFARMPSTAAFGLLVPVGGSAHGPPERELEWLGSRIGSSQIE